MSGPHYGITLRQVYESEKKLRAVALIKKSKVSLKEARIFFIKQVMWICIDSRVEIIG